MMTIHNLKFQGVWDVKTIQRFSGLPDYYFTPDKLEAYKDGNLLKGGLVYADAITTVSNTYAEEIKTPFYGEGLDGLMRARANDLRGDCQRHRLRRVRPGDGSPYRPELQREEFPQGED